MKIHIGEEYYEHTKCMKAFIPSSSIAGHVKIHGGDKPYIHIM